MHSRLLRSLLASALAGLFSASGASKAALNPSEQSVSDAIDQTCAQSTQGNPLCSALANGRNPDLTIQSITPLQILGIGSIATRITGGQMSLLNGMVTERGRLLHHAVQHGGAGDEFGSPLGFWFKADTGFGQRETTRTFAGFGFNNFGLNGGADYRITDNWVSGLAFTYHRNNARFDAGRGDTDSDAYSGSIYTSYYITDGLHVEATGSYGGLDYDTVRNVLLPTGREQLRGSPGARNYTFSFGGGYDFSYQSFTFAPYARVDYLGLDVEGFRESGGISAVQFDKQNIRSLMSSVGGQVSTAISFPWGVLSPQLRTEWHHQFLDNARQVHGAFLTAPSTSQFTIFGGPPDRDYYTLGGDVSAQFAQGISAFLSYQTLLGSRHIESHRVMLGTRLEF